MQSTTEFRKLLFILAEKLIVILGAILAIAVTGGTVLAILCSRSDQCLTSDWLQVWVEIWGFILATTTFLGSWIAANRKPELHFQIKQNDEIVKELEIPVTELKADKCKIWVFLENTSPIPASHLKMEIELEYLDDLPEGLTSRWPDHFPLEVWFDPNYWYFCAPSPQVKLPKLHRHTIAGGSDIVAYAQDEPQRVAICTIKPLRFVAPGLTEHDFYQLNGQLHFRLYTDKVTATGPSIPVTFLFG